MDLRSLVMLSFQVSLLLTVFSFGLQATWGDVLFLVRRPGLLVRSLVAMFVIVPVAVILLVQAFDTPRTEEIVLVALAFSPVPPLLPRKLQKAGARTGYSVGLLATMSLLSIVVVPLLVSLTGIYVHRQLFASTTAIGRLIVRSVVLPLLAGLLVRQLVPRFARRVETPIGAGASVLLLAAVLVLLIETASDLWRLSDVETLLMMAAFVGIGLVAGHLLGGPEHEHQGVLALASATRHPGIALTLANANYPGERFGGTVLLYLLVCALLCVPYIKGMSARRPLAARTNANEDRQDRRVEG
jgi:BASS family bile acid:Na+ symporter